MSTRPSGGSADVVIVGAGHNGLVAATLLARAGRSVLVLERREQLGGAAVSGMPFPGVGHGGQEFFTYQARAFLDEIAGLDRLPRQATFADGLRNLQVQRAITEAAATGSATQVTL